MWIRVGPAKRGASQQEERILVEKRTALQRTFDVRPCHDCTLDDLVLDLFTVSYLPAAVDRDVISENQRSLREQMASLRIYDLTNDCPTNAGALLFAKDPLRWVAGSYVQFVRWAGTTMADDPIMHRSYESNAPVQFYWYEDRIDIQSPGGLYGMASPENFPRQTDYRNPVIAEAMATLGYVNHFGRGVIRAQDALRRNGNPEASFTFEPSHVLATIRSKP